MVGLVLREELLPPILNQVRVQHLLKMLELDLLQLGGQLTVLGDGLNIERIVGNLGPMVDFGKVLDALIVVLGLVGNVVKNAHLLDFFKFEPGEEGRKGTIPSEHMTQI